MKMNKFIYVGPVLMGLTASYAIAKPNTHQQVQQVRGDFKAGRIVLYWTFVNDITSLVSLIDKNSLYMSEIDSLADKLSHDYEKSFSFITAQGDYMEREIDRLCNQERSPCNNELAVIEAVRSLEVAIKQYKQVIPLLPSLENVKGVVNALKKDPKAEKRKLTELKTAVENAKLKIEPAFLHMQKLERDLVDLVYDHERRP